MVNELVPGAAPLEHRHERGLHFEDVEGVLLEVHVVLAEARVGEGAVERGGALRLHLRLLALVAVEVPQRGADRLVYQRKVLVLPGQVHRHDPDRLAQRVRRVLLA